MSESLPNYRGSRLTEPQWLKDFLKSNAVPFEKRKFMLESKCAGCEESTSLEANVDLILAAHESPTTHFLSVLHLRNCQRSVNACSVDSHIVDVETGKIVDFNVFKIMRGRFTAIEECPHGEVPSDEIYPKSDHLKDLERCLDRKYPRAVHLCGKWIL